MKRFLHRCLNKRKSAGAKAPQSLKSKSREKSEGLHVLLDPPLSERSLDVVLIHGLHAHWLDSYTDRATGVCWMRDLLPLDLPNSPFRLLSFGYDTGASDSEPMEVMTRNFLCKLIDLRRETQTDALPLLFIAHSLGGIILKSALALSADAHDALCVAPATALFFGVPTNYVRDYERIRSDAADEITMSPPMRVFRQDLVFLGATNVRFDDAGLPARFHCQYFTENTGLEDVRPLEEGELARLPTQERIRLSKGHGPMVRYADREEPDYQRVAACVKAAVERLLASAPPT
ncbi:hypothetical protein BD626DRAFT_491097 [Schizophyllum amplum]|uniref:DUF676 domain-containing protein n=1 Tax=Schizophyllum amplum TaxID=97359 RepID=A0A550CHC0_9AGAR|nr:hypothetical protein BD626DRAFT_491097 [Auriculariopsis ampla]